jgi:transcriptional regulator
VFRGTYANISPDWYGKTHDDVPTWNYVAVHVSGKGRVVSDPEKVDAFLADLSAHEEHRRPDLDRGGVIWTIAKTDPKAHARMRAAIVAFEIDIEKIDAKAKLSQNKPAEALEGVIKALDDSGSQMSEAVARAMRELRRR